MPRAADGGEPMRQTPLWSFRYLDARGSPWSWESTEGDGADSEVHASDIACALCRLKDLESSTWMQIEQERGRRSNGAIDVENLERAAQERLRALGLETFDPLYHLRVDGATRIWGYRDGRTLCIIWLDRHHTVYVTKERP